MPPMRKGKYLLGLLIGVYAQTNVGIGTTSPTHRLHLASGTLRVEALSGTGTVLAQTDNQGVLGRFSAALSSGQFLRGDGTWGPSEAGDWKLTGNASTNPSIHYVGTVDAQDFRLATDGQTAWRILSTGYHWVGRHTTTTIENGLVSVEAPSGWIAVYGYKSTGDIPAVRGTIGGSTSGPAVMALNTNSNGWGAIGLGSNSTIGTLPTNGGGAYGAGSSIGVWGSFQSNANVSGYAGGAFAVRDAGGTYDWVYVAGYEGTIQRKIWGVGSVSTNIYDVSSQQYHTLFAPEMPEILFWDQGRFTIAEARVWVPIDTLLSQHI
ncbi:MAG: hypothetical protein RMK98_07855, partial [Bacteroidia bacterium]|nr:hypothetical protein [Bacteroidia bacterium]